MNEHDIQHYAVLALRKAGFACCVTSNGRRTANTKGTPDVFVNIGKGQWIALEFKQPKGKVSKEQQLLVEQGLVYLVTSIEEAVLIAISSKRRVK